jgi:hypothetical protein
MSLGCLQFEILGRQETYGVHGRKGIRQRLRFPRRPNITGIMQLEKERYWQQ